MKVLSVSGYSKSGKTATVIAIINELKKRHYSVVSIKDIHNKDFAMEKIGTDTWKHWHSSQNTVVARGLNETHLIWHDKLNLNEILYHLQADWVIIEGMRNEPLPRIICAKNENELSELIDETVFAISGIYSQKNNSYKNLPVFNVISSEIDVIKLVDLIEEKVFDVLPLADPKCCSECGMSCYEMVGKILSGQRKRSDCIADRHEVAELFINGQKIKIVPFVQRILRDATSSIVRNLDNCEKGNITIKIYD
jgi:molybdopterin-guanine dinucleotide biosynthesis protein B